MQLPATSHGLTSLSKNDDESLLLAVGSIIGAVTGSLIGLAAESGPLRGAGIGAISGAVFAIEAFHSSLAIWHSNEPGVWSVLFVVSS